MPLASPATSVRAIRTASGRAGRRWEAEADRSQPGNAGARSDPSRCATLAASWWSASAFAALEDAREREPDPVAAPRATAPSSPRRRPTASPRAFRPRTRSARPRRRRRSRRRCSRRTRPASGRGRPARSAEVAHVSHVVTVTARLAVARPRRGQRRGGRAGRGRRSRRSADAGAGGQNHDQRPLHRGDRVVRGLAAVDGADVAEHPGTTNDERFGNPSARWMPGVEHRPAAGPRRSRSRRGPGTTRAAAEAGSRATRSWAAGRGRPRRRSSARRRPPVIIGARRHELEALHADRGGGPGLRAGRGARRGRRPSRPPGAAASAPREAANDPANGISPRSLRRRALGPLLYGRVTLALASCSTRPRQAPGLGAARLDELLEALQVALDALRRSAPSFSPAFSTKPSGSNSIWSITFGRLSRRACGT